MLDGTRIATDDRLRGVADFFSSHTDLPCVTIELLEDLMTAPQFSLTSEILKRKPVASAHFNDYLSHLLKGLAFEHLDQSLADNYHIIDEVGLVRAYSRIFPTQPVVNDQFNHNVIGINVPHLMTFRETNRYLQLASIVDVKVWDTVHPSLHERTKRFRNPNALFTGEYASWQEADGSMPLTRLFQSVGVEIPNKPIIYNQKSGHRVYIAATEDSAFDVAGATRLPIPISRGTLWGFARSLAREYQHDE